MFSECSILTEAWNISYNWRTLKHLLCAKLSLTLVKKNTGLTGMAEWQNERGGGVAFCIQRSLIYKRVFLGVERHWHWDLDIETDIEEVSLEVRQHPIGPQLISIALCRPPSPLDEQHGERTTLFIIMVVRLRSFCSQCFPSSLRKVIRVSFE